MKESCWKIPTDYFFSTHLHYFQYENHKWFVFEMAEAFLLIQHTFSPDDPLFSRYRKLVSRTYTIATQQTHL